MLDLLDSAVLEHGQVGSVDLQHLVARSVLQARPAVGTADWCSWAALASEFWGWIDQALLVAFNLKAWSVGLWHVAANKLETCSMDRLQV